MVAFMREEREMMVSAMETQRHEMQALLEQEREQNMKLREQVLLRKQTQIAALQSRVQALHAAQLLTDEELHRIEDAIADGCELGAADSAGGGEVARMVALSERVAVEGAFARQLRRKYA